MVQPVACGRRDGRLSVEGNAEACSLQHRDVVGAVANCRSRFKRERAIRSQSLENLGFALAIEDRLRNQAGDLAVGDNQMIGVVLVETTDFGNDGSENVKAAGNQGRMGTPCPHGKHEPPGAGHQFNARRHGLQHSSRPAGEKADPFAERLGEFYLASHASRRDRRDGIRDSQGGGKLIEQFSGDYGRFHVRHENPFAPPRRALRREVDRRIAKALANDLLRSHRFNAIERNIAGNVFRQPAGGGDPGT